MTPAAPNPAVEGFLGRFFADPNRLRQDSKPEIAIWVERIRRGDPQPTVLPCFRGGTTVDWYGLAFDDRQLTALGESLTAFVGPTYTTFRGEVARLDPTDPIDCAVRDLTGSRACKFRGEEPKEIWRVLERMRRVWERRGTRQQATPRPVARLLRDFYMALRARDENVAQEALLLLREGGHLDGLNHLYLQVQFLSAFHRWAEISGHSQLPDLLRLRRPSAVTEAILQAVYHLHLARFEDPGDPRQAADTFRAEVLPRYPSLFVTRAGMRSAEAVKSFMLLAVTAAPANLVLRDELLTHDGLDASDVEYLNQLALLAEPSPQPVAATDPLAAATDAARANDYDRAFALAKVAAPSVARARLLCECAFELGTLDARSQAINAVGHLPEADRTEFLSRRVNQQLWDSLRNMSDPGSGDGTHITTLPRDWCSWLDHLDRHDGGEGSREIARRGATEWAVEPFTTTGAERFVQQLSSNRSQAAERALRDSLPYLLTFFERDPSWPNPRFRGVYRSLIDVLFYSTEGGRADLTVFYDLVDGVLVHGVGAASDYAELVTYATDLWTRFAAPTTADWGIETADLLVAHPCPDPTARGGFFQALLDRLVGFGRHVSPDQRFLLRLLSTDLGVADTYNNYFRVEEADNSVEGDSLSAAEGLSVAAYTLTERAARQFQQVLEAQAPGVRVSLCHDTVASSRLKQLARQADLFVMVTASAKHAATTCIEANRPIDRPLLRPTGRGAASMLRAVRDYFARVG